MVYVVPVWVWVWLDKHYGLCCACLGVGVVGYVLSSMLCLFGCGCGWIRIIVYVVPVWVWVWLNKHYR
jgi:hypothetical protein